MCRQSHHTQHPSSPTSSFQRARSWLSQICTASPTPGVPMAHFPTPKGSHLFFPPVGQQFGGGSLTHRHPTGPLCMLGRAKCIISDLGASDVERGMSQPALTASSSTHPAPDIPVSFVLHTFFLSCFPAPLSPQQCHRVAGLLPS